MLSLRIVSRLQKVSILELLLRESYAVNTLSVTSVKFQLFSDYLRKTSIEHVFGLTLLLKKLQTEVTHLAKMWKAGTWCVHFQQATELQTCSVEQEILGTLRSPKSRLSGNLLPPSKLPQEKKISWQSEENIRMISAAQNLIQPKI